MLKLRLSDPSAFEDLQMFLMRTGCIAVLVADDLLQVHLPEAEREREERTEIVARIRAWQARRSEVAVEFLNE
jgi:hypothetical protein